MSQLDEHMKGASRVTEVNEDKKFLPLFENNLFKFKPTPYEDDMYELVKENRKELLLEMLENRIKQIGSPNCDTAIKAIEHVDQLILSKIKSGFLIRYEDPFMIAITDQLKHLKTYVPKENPNVRKVYRYLFTILFNFYQNELLGRHVTTSVLKDIIYQYIAVQVEDGFGDEYYTEMADKICEFIIDASVYTNVICAFIQLLHDCGKSNTSSRIIDFLLKYLRRLLRNMPNAKYNDIDFDTVLLDVHLFLKDFPTKPVETQLPTKAIKNIIWAMCECMGRNLLSHFTKIPNSNDSELKACILKMFKRLAAGGRFEDLD